MMSNYFFKKPWYIFLLLVFFVFHGFTENFFLIPLADCLLLLLTYLGVSLLLMGLLWIYFKDIPKAAFLAFLVLSFNFFFGYFHDGIVSFFPDSFITKYSVNIALAILILTAIAIVLKKRKVFSKKLILYLNVLFLFFIVTDMVVIAKKITAVYDKDENYADGEKISFCSKEKPANVYLIIMDEYAGSKDLLDVGKFDNSFFLDSLRKTGFFVANNSRSNYNYTTYSMASLLNMDYLPLKDKQVRKADHTMAMKMIFKNKVTSLFQANGYTIRNHSAFDIAGVPAHNNNSFIPARTSLFTSQTLISRLKKDVWLNVARKLNLRRVLLKSLYENRVYNEHIYDQVMNELNQPDNIPKFAYVHLQLPHYPYYYDKEGNPYPLEKISIDMPGNTKNYVEYVQYTNKLLLRLIDKILKSEKQPPVIILMSDHGYRSFPAEFTEDYVFINLFSIYLPDKNYTQFYDSITNVNVFQTLFNTNFCQQLPLLKDTTIIVRN